MELEINLEPITVEQLINQLETYDLNTKFDYDYSLCNDNGVIMIDYIWNSQSESNVEEILESLKTFPNDSKLSMDIDDGYKYADIIGVRFDAYHTNKLTFIDSCYK